MATATLYWCYRCSRFVRILNQDRITCPDCDGGFLEEISNNRNAARALHANFHRLNSDIFPAAAMHDNGSTTPSTVVLRRSRRYGSDRSPFNPVIVLRGGASTSSSASPSSSVAEENLNSESSRGYELYYDDGGRSGLRPLPRSMSEFLLGSGFDRIISQMEIQNLGRSEQPPASNAAVEAMPTVEINETHIEKELYCAVCKEQFEFGTKVRNMPCNHLYHSNCILPWLQLRNSCPICRHELPATNGGEEGAAETGDGFSNSSAAEEVPAGLTIWRLPGGGFAVGRFSGRRGENREFPVVYTEMDGGFSGGGSPRRISWGIRRNSGGERRFFGRVFQSLFGCFRGRSNSYPRLDSRISRNSRSVLLFSASSRRRGWGFEVDNGRRW